MKSYIIQEIGQLPVQIEKEMPLPAADEAMVHLKASALNHRDVWITKGLYPGIRLGATMGADGCGIDRDGREVVINPGLDWGDREAYQSPTFRVLGVPDEGTFANDIMINKKYIYPKPAHLSYHEAAALPLAGLTAYRALMVRANLQKNDKVLISGIGGGVALFAMQFALALDCAVYVTSGSDDKIAKAISLGASGGYNYRDPEWTKKLQSDTSGVDVIVDSAAGAGFNQLIKVCNPGGRIVFYGGTHGKIDGLNPQPIFWKQISLLGSTMGSDTDFGNMLDFVSHHKIKPVIDTVYKLDNLHQGFEAMEAGLQFGKIVFDHQ